MTEIHPAPVLVTGASGKTGRRVLARLTTAGHTVRGVGRREPGALRSEEAVAGSGVPTVVVRSAFFAQGFTEDLLAEAVAAGLLRLPAGATAEPFVDLEDLADVAVAGLLGALDPGVHEL